MLQAARRQKAQQARLVELALGDARRVAVRGSLAVAGIVATYQAHNVAVSLQATPLVLQEQGIPADADASVVAGSLLTDRRSSAAMLDSVDTDAEFTRLVASLVQDAGRTASAVDMVTRPKVTGYVRVVGGKSCARCAILAGRVYRYSTDFQRHPQCDCTMQPTTLSIGRDYTTDPMEAFHAGRIRGLSRADTKAINEGADISQVVNVRRKSAGLTVQNSVIARAGRLTPAGIFRVASSREEAVTLMRRYGYLT